MKQKHIIVLDVGKKCGKKMNEIMNEKKKTTKFTQTEKVKQCCLYPALPLLALD